MTSQLNVSVPTLTLDRFPSDILNLIFEFLSWGDHVHRLSRTCRRLRAVCSSRWHPQTVELHMEKTPSSTVFLDTLRYHAPHVRFLRIVATKRDQLYVNGDMKNCVSEMLNFAFPLLECLEIPGFDFTAAHPKLLSFSERSPRLRCVLLFNGVHSHPAVASFQSPTKQTVSVFVASSLVLSQAVDALAIFNYFTAHHDRLDRYFPSVKGNLLCMIMNNSGGVSIEMVQSLIATKHDLLRSFCPKPGFSHIPWNPMMLILGRAKTVEVIEYALTHLESTNRRLEEPKNFHTIDFAAEFDQMSRTFDLFINTQTAHVSYIAVLKFHSAAILHRLVALGAKTHIWLPGGDTLLHTFIWNAQTNPDFYEELIKCGAPLNPARTDPTYARVAHCAPVLYRAVSSCLYNSSRILINYSSEADVNWMHGHMNPLMMAVKESNSSTKIIKLLLAKGANVCLTAQGLSLLDLFLVSNQHYSTRYQIYSILPRPVRKFVLFLRDKLNCECTIVKKKLLHKYFLERNDRTQATGTPNLFCLLHLLLIINDFVKALATGTTEWIDDVDDKGRTLLDIAVAQKMNELFKVLIKLGANYRLKLHSLIEIATKDRFSPKAKEILELLSKFKADDDRMKKQIESPSQQSYSYVECGFCLRRNFDEESMRNHLIRRHRKSLRQMNLNIEKCYSGQSIDGKKTRLFVQLLLCDRIEPNPAKKTKPAKK